MHRSFWHAAAPAMPSALACPEEDRADQRNYKGKAESRGDFPLLFPFIPEPPRSGPLPRPPHIRGGAEIQDRLTASHVGKEIPDLERVLTSPRLPRHIRPQVFLLVFRVRYTGPVRVSATTSKKKDLLPRRLDFFFFFVYSLLACDLGRSWRGYVQSGSRPQSALVGSLQVPLLPSAQACPKKM